MLLIAYGNTSNAIQIAHNLVNQDINPKEVDYFKVTMSISLANSSESESPIYSRVFNAELTATTDTRQFWGASSYENTYADSLSSYFNWYAYPVSIIYNSSYSEWQVWVPNHDFIVREFELSADADYSVDVEIIAHISNAYTTHEFTSMINDVVDKRIIDSSYMLIGVDKFDSTDSSGTVTIRYTLDRTANEILEAVESGKSVWVDLKSIYNTLIARALLVGIVPDNETHTSRSESASSTLYFIFGQSDRLAFKAQTSNSYPYIEITEESNQDIA